MFNESNYERIFTGSQINAQYLQTLLNEKKIHSVIRDDFQSSLRAGFGVNYTDQVQVFVEKDNLVQAKHVVEKAFDDTKLVGMDSPRSEETASSGRDSSSLSRSATDQTLAKEETREDQEYTDAVENNAGKHKPQRSTLNLVLNLVLVIFSAWRLWPLLRGESLPAWRIALSGFILIVCSATLIMHFRPRRS
ncbi:hypothetical protein [Croceiramulus getboli]|nr:DUF2007 domain-containing protein [Flavobacteriaceae bacterium YJPT1-3]